MPHLWENWAQGCRVPRRVNAVEEDGAEERENLGAVEVGRVWRVAAVTVDQKSRWKYDNCFGALSSEDEETEDKETCPCSGMCGTHVQGKPKVRRTTFEKMTHRMGAFEENGFLVLGKVGEEETRKSRWGEWRR